ncbi:MAG: phosphoglucosamine mutase, partial [Clostridia bacterium]|nr:phosphoglucosamine mutase [Clostridia bacterium]
MKLFGTDGIRGIAGKELTSELAYRLGASLYRVLAERNCRPTVIIGRDTRESGPMLEDAVARGISDMGGNVLIAGVVPTPAVAFLAISESTDAGVMISASHNPAEYNGLKVFGRLGYKLPDAEENRIEELILGDDSFSPAADKGKVVSDSSLREKYIRHVRRACVQLSGR